MGDDDLTDHIFFSSRNPHLAKFYKRPTKKEKLGLSSNSAQIRTAIKFSKFNQPEQPTILKHERHVSSSSTNNNDHQQQQQHSLIENPGDEDEKMTIEDEPLKKKRTGLKSKVLKKSKNLTLSDKSKDYVDLYDQPDRRKKGKTSKQSTK